MMTPEQQRLFIELGCPDMLRQLREDRVKYQQRWWHAIRLLEDVLDERFKECPIEYKEWLDMTKNAIEQYDND
jgi:hypothetical protein